MTEQCPVDHVVVMSVRQQQVRDLGGLDAMFGKLVDEQATHADRAAVDHQHPASATNQGDRAPTQAGVIDRPARKTLHENIDFVIIEFDVHLACSSPIRFEQFRTGVQRERRIHFRSEVHSERLA